MPYQVSWMLAVPDSQTVKQPHSLTDRQTDTDQTGKCTSAFPRSACFLLQHTLFLPSLMLMCWVQRDSFALWSIICLQEVNSCPSTMALFFHPFRNIYIIWRKKKRSLWLCVCCSIARLFIAHMNEKCLDQPSYNYTTAITLEYFWTVSRNIAHKYYL